MGENLQFAGQDNCRTLLCPSYVLRASKDKPLSKDVLGTDGYIAPEAYLGDVCPKSDIFSAGVIMFLLVAGRSRQ